MSRKATAGELLDKYQAALTGRPSRRALRAARRRQMLGCLAYLVAFWLVGGCVLLAVLKLA